MRDIQIHEHRAPTDWSIKLLREMEEKIEQNRIASIRLDINEVNGVIDIYQDMMNLQTRGHAVFDVNGKRCEATAYVGYLDQPEQLLLKLRDEIAKVIANEIMTSFLEAKPHFWKKGLVNG